MGFLKNGRKGTELLLGSIVKSYLFICVVLAIVISPPDDLSWEGSGLKAFYLLLTSQLGEPNICSVTTLITFLWVYWNYLRRRTFKYPLRILCVATLYSLFMVIGISYSTTYGASFLYFNGAQLAISFSVFVGFSVIFYYCVGSTYLFLSAPRFQAYIRRPLGRFSTIIRGNLAFTIFSGLLLVWLAFYLPTFPGSVPYDGRILLSRYFGYLPMDLHHPYLPGLFLGFLYEAGNTIFHNFYGAMLVVVLGQMLLGAIVFTKAALFVYHETHSERALVLSVCFYAVLPVWPLYFQTAIKDTLFFVFFCWYFMELVKVFLNQASPFTFLSLGLAGCLCCLQRYGAVVVVVGGFLAVLNRKNLKPLLASCTITVAVALSFNYLWLPSRGYQFSNTAEMLSIPLQQLARTVNTKKIDQEDLAQINRALPLRAMARYNPQLSDPVKNALRTSQIRILVPIYLKYLLKYPLTYLSATLNNTFAYFYPFYFPYADHYPITNAPEINKSDSNITYSKYAFGDSGRFMLLGSLYLANRIPLVSLFVSPAFYSWLVVLAMGFTYYKRNNRGLLLFIPLLLTLLVCVASPVNGYVRYMLPLMATAPLICVIPFSKKFTTSLTSNANF